jgi:3-hydroxybutyryl-CoA dehydrogenase
MKIVLLANEEQKDELTAQQETVPGLLWPVAIESLPGIGSVEACIDLQFDNSRERIDQLGKLNTSLQIVNSVMRLPEGPARNFVRINGWKTFLNRQIVEATGPDSLKSKAEDLFMLLNKRLHWVENITGFISLRVISAIINEAYFALEEKVSSKADIDIAMKLGTNYPFGPFEWSKMIGINNVYQLLNDLSASEERYTPSSLLKIEAGG